MSEILAPAGDAQSFSAAIDAGADAVYLGLTDFSARKSAENFTLDNLKEYADKAHLFGVKVYVALNTLVKEKELADFFRCAREAWNAGADALIIQDIFLGKMLHECYPEIVLHLSTQAGVCNAYGAKLAKRYGFSRVILARETPIRDIAEIAAILETEVFVQGALCTCFSGQCYLSSFAGGNSGNRGFCKQPCRKKYSVKGNGKQEFAYRLSLSDLCVGEKISALVEAGVCSFKIEGRMRSATYVSAAVAYYKDLLAGESYKKLQSDLSDVRRAFNRGNYTLGYAFGQDKNLISSEVQGHIGEKIGSVSMPKDKKYRAVLVTPHEKLYFVRSVFTPSDGDGFKILREGKEVCGGVWRKYFPSVTDGFYLSAKVPLLEGDSVCVTTDNALQERLSRLRRKILLHLFCKTEKGRTQVTVRTGDRSFSFDAPFAAEPARSRPFSLQDFTECFEKTDDFPFKIAVDGFETDGEYFLLKSSLNAFRRKVYADVLSLLLPVRMPLQERSLPNLPAVRPRKVKRAVIDSAFSLNVYRDTQIEYAIIKPKNYTDKSSIKEILQNTKYFARHSLLYIPAFCTGEDLERIKNILSLFDGIYAEGVFAIELKRETGGILFAGTGFNLLNPYSAALAAEECEEICLSKELSDNEQKIFADGYYRFAGGSVKLMELGHCPFSKKCNTCEDRDVYEMSDEGGRQFYLLRYRNSCCRFEVYNGMPMVSASREGVFDLTLLDSEQKYFFLLGETGKIHGISANRKAEIR